MRPDDDIRTYRSSFIGMIVLVVAAFLVLASRPTYGWGGLAGLGVLWVIAFLVALRLFLHRPSGVLVVSLLMVAAWGGTVLLNR